MLLLLFVSAVSFVLRWIKGEIFCVSVYATILLFVESLCKTSLSDRIFFFVLFSRICFNFNFVTLASRSTGVSFTSIRFLRLRICYITLSHFCKAVSSDGLNCEVALLHHCKYFFVCFVIFHCKHKSAGRIFPTL